MLLDRYTSGDFDRGAPRWKEALWLVANGLLLSSWVPGSGWRRTLLATFGAKLGKGVVVKQGVRVKFPWRLKVGDHSWIGEGVWIDNLADVVIGDHVCISQSAYLCTGSHDWSCLCFGLITRPITIEDHVWIGARASVAPGTILHEGAVLSMSSFGQGRLKSWAIHTGTPAVPKKQRIQPSIADTP